MCYHWYIDSYIKRYEVKRQLTNVTKILHSLNQYVKVQNEYTPYRNIRLSFFLWIIDLSNL